MKHNCVYMCSIEWASLYFIVVRCRRIIHFIRYAGIWQKWRDACEKKKTTKQTVRPLSTLCTQSLLQFLFFFICISWTAKCRNRKLLTESKIYVSKHTHTQFFSAAAVQNDADSNTHNAFSNTFFVVVLSYDSAMDWGTGYGQSLYCAPAALYNGRHPNGLIVYWLCWHRTRHKRSPLQRYPDTFEKSDRKKIHIFTNSLRLLLLLLLRFVLCLYGARYKILDWNWRVHERPSERWSSRKMSVGNKLALLFFIAAASVS